MADAGQQLVDLIEARIARGEHRLAAQAATFRECLDLVRQWHFAEGQDELPEPQRREEPIEVDPGQVLLQHIDAMVARGLPRERAQRLAIADHPELFEAYHRGERFPADSFVCFRATASHLVGDQLIRVPVFKASKWNGRSYSEAHLDSMVDAVAGGHFAVPLKIGHDDAPGVPAVSGSRSPRPRDCTPMPLQPKGKLWAEARQNPSKTSRAGAWSGLQSFSPRASAAPTSVPVDQHASEDGHRAGMPLASGESAMALIPRLGGQWHGG